MLLSIKIIICWFHHFQSCTNGKGSWIALIRAAVYLWGVGRLKGTGILCGGSLCSSTAWLQPVKVDHQTLARITGQLDPVGAVCKSFDYAVGFCPRVMQFLGVVPGQDGSVQPHEITNLVKLAAELVFQTSGIMECAQLWHVCWCCTLSKPSLGGSPTQRDSLLQCWLACSSTFG